MKKNVGTNKSLAERRANREQKRKGIRAKKREFGLKLKLERSKQIAQMRKLFNEAVQKRRAQEANGEVFENDIMTDLINETYGVQTEKKENE